jgi:hypothetical protein
MLVDYYRLSDLRYIHTRVCLCKLCVGVRYMKELSQVCDLFGWDFRNAFVDGIQNIFFHLVMSEA